MNKLYNTFENQLREKMAGHEMPYDPQHWNALQASLQPKGRSTSAVIVALLATFTVVGTGGLIWHNTVNESSSAKLASNQELGIHTSHMTKVETVVVDSYITTTEATVQQHTSNGAAPEQSTSGSPIIGGNGSSDSITQYSDPSNGQNTNTPNTATDVPTHQTGSEKISIAMSTNLACAGTEIEFKVTSLPEGVKGNYIWNFGDGKFKAETAPTNTYSKPGEYDISLSITDDNGRISTTVMNKAIVIVPAPRPEFGWHFVNEDPAHPMVQMTNTSSNANSAEWKLSNGTKSTEINPSFALDGKGKHMVALQVQNAYGCSGGTVKHVVINSELDLKAPAQLKSSNMVFMPELLKSNKYNFVMSVYAANGTKVYETSNRTKGWDGGLPGGLHAQAGEQYQWKVIITNDLTKEEKYFNGTLTIIP